MGLTFLVPVFLAGVAAVVVPVLLHLTNRQKTEIIEFPSLMFLQRIPYKATNRRRLRDILLLALRMLALILLAAAFARPFLDRPLPPEVAANFGAREVVILLDRSYSMGYDNAFERARTEALAVVNDLDPDDRATLVLFDNRAEAVVRSTTERGRLRAILDTVSVSAAGTAYTPALRLAQSVLDPSELRRREVVLISDYQRTGWDGQEPVRLPPGAVLRTIDVSEPAPANLSVTDVSFRREVFAGAERVTATARIAAKGDEPFTAVPVVLEINGQQVAEERIDVDASGSTSVTFPPFTVSGRVRGTVRAGNDALPADNIFHFVVSADQSISVLVLEGSDSGAASSLYLTRALAIGERPSFHIDTKPVGQFQRSDLNGRAVVVLNDVGVPGGELGNALREFVRGGGGLLTILGGRVREASDLIPGTFGNAVDRGSGAVLASVDYSHPVFELFAAPRSGDLAAARFFRYRPFTLAEGATAVARFDDGAVALAESRLGEGRIAVWTTTLDNVWNDLVLQPVFLPLAHRMIQHLAGFAEPAPWFTVGQVVDLAGGRPGLAAGGTNVTESTGRADSSSATVARQPVAGAAAARAERAVVAPSGLTTEVGGMNPGFAELREQGFYEVRAVATREEPYVIAVNLDLAETDLSSFDPEEMVAAVVASTGADAVANTETGISIQERERQQSLWWYILLGTLVLLAAETWLANRRSRRAFQNLVPGERA
ncbi:MAG TPA: VWA domain-containing protein [Longimicrobiales bacterium]|nr:VWA domain-containing protein [Longimicrobiales bacterium]